MKSDEMIHLSCQKVAVFSDIHSNYSAFAACYRHALQQGAGGFVFLGDYISDLADPCRTLDLVYEIRQKFPTACLLGNRERYMLECRAGMVSFRKGSKTGSLLFTYEQLREQDFAFFESLPIYDRIAINGMPFEIAHATEHNDRYYFDETDGKIETVFSEMKENYMLTGHSHRQYMERRGIKTIINSGSIGVPRRYGYLTQYAMLECANQTVKCSLYQIPYDVKEMIRRQFESGLTECAPYWAIAILYDVMKGEEYALTLLEKVLEYANGDESVIHNEQIWRKFAMEMGLELTEKKITDEFESDLR